MIVKSILNVKRIFIAFLIIAILFSVASVSSNSGPRIDFKHPDQMIGDKSVDDGQGYNKPVGYLDIDLIRTGSIQLGQVPVF